MQKDAPTPNLSAHEPGRAFRSALAAGKQRRRQRHDARGAQNQPSPQASSLADKGMTLAGHRTNLAAGKQRHHGGRAAFRNLGGAIPLLRKPALPTLPPARKTSAPCRGGGASNGAEERAAMRTQTRPSAAAKRRASPPGNLRCAGAFPTATFSRLPARFEPLCMEFQKFGRTAPPCHRAANIEGPAPGVARARFRQSGAILPAPEGRFTA